MYVNGRHVLPPKLLEQVQEYVQGKQLYIPKHDDTRTAWGEKSGTKAELRRRNRQILATYEKGARIEQLAAEHFLSEDSIRRIICKTRKERY